MASWGHDHHLPRVILTHSNDVNKQTDNITKMARMGEKLEAPQRRWLPAGSHQMLLLLCFSLFPRTSTKYMYNLNNQENIFSEKVHLEINGEPFLSWIPRTWLLSY